MRPQRRERPERGRGKVRRGGAGEIALRTRSGRLLLRVLYEDREVIAIDKPEGWMLAPVWWDRTRRNLLGALVEGVEARAPWALERHISFIRPVHRLDTETSGVLLLAKSPGALRKFGKWFEARAISKRYLAVVAGAPQHERWECGLSLALHPDQSGRIRPDPEGREALTLFRAITSGGGRTLVEAEPITGRTHQIRVHLETCGLPIVGDPLYRGGRSRGEGNLPLGLRACWISWGAPAVAVSAPCGEFLERFGFLADAYDPRMR